MRTRFPYRLIGLLALLISVATSALSAEVFTVVIDPGHGGKDPGALGTIVREKDIVLDVGLRLGKAIQAKHPDVKVIYTRDTDVFIPLQNRANIANKAKADLFISIHADWAPNKTAKGASTFTLGQNRSKENLEIAKRENSVILLEEDYQQRYEGFDPNSAESYIMFQFMQDNYMNQSIHFASTLQQRFIANGRADRGVRQDVFLVLRNTSMPSVLVELGFLTNPEEERFLSSQSGRQKLANSILDAFTAFKTEYDQKNGLKNENGSQATSTQADPSGLVYRVQTMLSPSALPARDSRFKGIKMDHYVEKGYYKYTVGAFSSFHRANEKRKELSKQFPDAFVVSFLNGERIPVNEARKRTNEQ